jgi:hypothetical protein
LTAVWTTTAHAALFNVDIDQIGAMPPHGGGAPSSTFGAAAGQPGFWNPVSGIALGPTPLLDTAGAATPVTLTVTSSSTALSDLSYLQPLNTGDYALLLNDASQIGTLSQGGSRTYTFAGLSPGWYKIYTYAVAPQATVVPNPVLVPGAIGTNPEIVNGPMPGNAFAQGITHSIHDVLVTTGTLDVVFNIPANLSGGAYVNGFQIVPEPATVSLAALGGLAMIRRLRRKPC